MSRPSHSASKPESLSGTAPLAVSTITGVRKRGPVGGEGLVVVAGVLVGQLDVKIDPLVKTVFFALFLSLALQPFVVLLERIRMPRSLAVLLVLVILAALVTFFIVIVLPVGIDAGVSVLRIWATSRRPACSIASKYPPPAAITSFAPASVPPAP